jgi:membrane associated rhomboid family serine protease
MAGMQYMLGPRSASRSERRWRVPVATVVLFFVISTPSILQFFYPDILSSLMRNASAVRSGEWWRLATAIMVQDGGIGGTVFNLLGLLVAGTFAEHVWGTRHFVLLVIGGVAVSEVVAFTWQPLGAGNSVVNLSLAGSLCAVCLPRHRMPGGRIIASLALLAFAGLLALRDVHGPAAASGFLIGIGFLALDRRQLKAEAESGSQ